jgi:hypothetical protein
MARSTVPQASGFAARLVRSRKIRTGERRYHGMPIRRSERRRADATRESPRRVYEMNASHWRRAPAAAP